MSAPHILVKDDGRVRIITIDRPDRRNALTPVTVAEMEAALREAADGSDIGAVVLTGSGGHFSAGGDVDHILDAAGGDDDAGLLTMMRAFHRVVVEIWESRLPVVAAVSGIAYGGGINLALVCDLVVMSADARICEVFVKRGIVPDVAGAYLLPRIVGMHRARELMLLAPEIGAERALELGIANVVEPDADAALATAVAKAHELAAMPDYTVALTKKLVNRSLDADLRGSLELEAVTQAAALRSKAAVEGFEAFRQSRGKGRR
ncbi:MAG: enoyl-CoA hydratase/isomerase family protein [Pseudonocardia sp.]|uniref:enoyl-CoA hydratase/isomerase family protein n=1 Tax=unclassified Pseudonocardia TaxID=2619320 RepID=UPI000869E78F|nr:MULTISPECIES: enoyl-CoA hydratase/isomerase family protein [unclassified Pseudonocardia]MBN9109153.1 enoyl-CoA hydratase/isomerase family protein [Pseudonocardia sp.]ODU10961.1 MAG: enoyl-CoA hydratase [Pseudonocardia sp. SCN 72-51]ODV01453.1 MAG: enoyl-CoA hydratase [Pseudonocardia sp. SCN 73-27]